MGRPRKAKKPGLKLDAGKDDWTLLFLMTDALREVVRVFMFGEKKYTRGGWEHVENARDRYTAALARHATSWYGGERNDAESERHHLACAACCVLFLLALDLRGKLGTNKLS